VIKFRQSCRDDGGRPPLVIVSIVRSCIFETLCVNILNSAWGTKCLLARGEFVQKQICGMAGTGADRKRVHHCVDHQVRNWYSDQPCTQQSGSAMNLLLVILRFLFGLFLQDVPRLQPVVVHSDGRTSGGPGAGSSCWDRSSDWGWLTPRMRLHDSCMTVAENPWASDRRLRTRGPRQAPWPATGHLHT
jgi:hypothetical protein